MENLYLWLKALHIISFVSWMAALLYLPRLFVYHSKTLPMGEYSEGLKVMEYKLSAYIMRPAMIATFLFGGGLLYTTGFSFGWLHFKLLLVLLLAGFHGFLVSVMKRFQKDERPYSEKTFRFLNEVPTLLMIVIVFLVVLKPF